MSTELRLKVGECETATIWIDSRPWRNETVEDVPEATRIHVHLDGRDNLRFLVNGHNVAMVKPDGTMAFNCHSSDPEKDKEIKRLKVLGAEYSKENEKLKVQNVGGAKRLAEMVTAARQLNAENERLKAQNGKFAKENADMQVENHRLNAEIERLKDINKKGGERESKWIRENGELRQSRDTLNSVLSGRILEIHKIVHGDH